MMPAHYVFLTQPFLRGTVNGQIASVYRTRESHPEKVAEYRTALVNGDLNLGGTVTKQQARKLADMLIPLPQGVSVVSTRATQPA